MVDPFSISTGFATSQLDKLSIEMIIEILFQLNIPSLTCFHSLSRHAMQSVTQCSLSIQSTSILQSLSRVQQSRCQHLFVPFCWHSPRDLHIWGIKENSFRRRRVPVSARERVLMSTMSTIHSYQRKATLQRCISNPTASSPPITVPRVNWTTMTNVKQFAELRERLTLCNLAPRGGRWASGNGESVP